MIINKFITTKDHVIIYTRYTEDGDFFPHLETDHPDALKTNSICIFTTANSEHYNSNSYNSDGTLEWNKLSDVSGPLGAVYPIYDFDRVKGFGTKVRGGSNTSQVTVWTKEYMASSFQNEQHPKPMVCVENSASETNQNDIVSDILSDGNSSGVLREEPCVAGKYDMTDSTYHHEFLSDESGVDEDSLNIDWSNWEE